jgi:hypothetical protein
MKRALSVLLAVAATACSGGTKAGSADLSTAGNVDGGGGDLSAADFAAQAYDDLSVPADLVVGDLNASACEACLMSHFPFIYNACINDSTCACWLSCIEDNGGNFAKCATSCPMPNDTTANLEPAYVECLPCPDNSRPSNLDGGFAN